MHGNCYKKTSVRRIAVFRRSNRAPAIGITVSLRQEAVELAGSARMFFSFLTIS